MIFRKNAAVRMPGKPRTKADINPLWATKVVEALDALRSSIGFKERYNNRRRCDGFEIRRDGDDVLVTAGTAIETSILPDENSQACYAETTVQVQEHSFTPAANTTYGIWLRTGPWQGSNASELFPDSTAIGKLTTIGTTSPTIIESDQFTGQADAAALCADGDGMSYIWIGQVQIDGNGNVAQILQDRCGPLRLPALSHHTEQVTSDSQPFTIHTTGALLANLVSGDSDNAITIGADGGVFVVVVSDQGSNLITAGGDGGAFYEGPIVSEDANNDISTGSDGGAFYETPP